MKVLQQIRKSLSDTREYKAIQLPNKIQCVLIRDEEAQKSSAALSVGVGSFKDPIQAQGIAHYLEHMLFMGTQKYPDQNEYSNFITKNSGSNNAYTSQEQTNYQFEVSSHVFKDTLDRFAQFFISPLMSQSSSERQLNAVDSQHCKNLNSDAWRRFQLTKQLSKKDHPYRKFSTGNKETLTNQNLKKMLHDFYKENYSSNLMKLVVYGKEKIETLEEWVVEIFSGIPNKQYEKFTIPCHPYDEGALGKITKIVPVQDKKQLLIEWILQDKRNHYRNHPGSLVSSLIGHEGKGSILSFLIKQGLATALSSGASDNYDCYSDFSIIVELTDKGLTKIQDIIGYIKFYIQMVKKEGIPKWYFEQYQYIQKMNFDFMDKKKGMMESASIVSHMQKRNIQDLFIYPYLMQEWKPELINQYLSELRSDNIIVYFSAKEHESVCDLQEPIYKTKYHTDPLNKIDPITCDVSIPEKNSFVPKDLTILPMVEQKAPARVIETDYIQGYFKQDHRFKLPKINLNLRIAFQGNYCPREQVSRAIYLQMLNQHLREFAYLAETAKVDASVSFVSYYLMQIKVRCFRASIKSFLPQYLQKIFNFVPEDKEIYEMYVAKKKRAYSNYFLGDAYKIVYDLEVMAMRANSTIAPELKVEFIDTLTLQDVKNVSKNLNSKVFCEAYIGGNIQNTEVQQIFKLTEEAIKKNSRSLQKCYIAQLRTVKIPENSTSIIEHELWNSEEQNSAVSVHFQTDSMDLKTQMLHKLCQLLYRQPAFDFLRTKNQLGYIVFCLAEDHRCVGGMMILVQSGVKTSYELITYIDTFLNQHIKGILQQLNEQTFAEFKQALKSTKLEVDKNLAAESTRYWAQIVKHKYIFDRKQREIEAITAITLQQFKKFVNSIFYENPKRIQIHAVPQSKLELNNTVKAERMKTPGNIQIFKNAASFAKTKSLYPDFYTLN